MSAGNSDSLLRAHRSELHAGLGQLHMAADAVRGAEPRLALAALEQSLSFTHGTMLPHLRAEEFTLFPAFERVVDRPGALDVLVAQHRSIGRMADDLARVVNAVRAKGDLPSHWRYLDPLLHGLYAVARVHLESEDDVVLSMVEEHLSPSEIADIVAQSERVMRRLARTDTPRP